MNKLSAIALRCAVAGALAAASPAQASVTQLWDSFEGNAPWTRWEAFSGGGDGGAWFDINQGLAHNFSNNGWLYANYGWAFERLAVSMSGFPVRSNCTVAMWMQPVGGGAQVGLEVWDPNGWRKLASTYPWLPGPGYQPVVINSLDLSSVNTVYIQAIYGNSGGPAKWVRLDDAVLNCYY